MPTQSVMCCVIRTAKIKGLCDPPTKQMADIGLYVFP